MKNKEILLARHGLEKEDMKKFIQGDLCNAGKLLIGTGKWFNAVGVQLTDEDFIACLQETAQTIDSPGRGMLIDPVLGDLPITDFDPYIRGVIRWMNEMGIYTYGSCDGHGRGEARIYLKKFPNGKQLELLKAAVPPSLRLRMEGKIIRVSYPKNSQPQLLDFAENLYQVWKKPSFLHELQANHFKSLLIECLTIPGVSTDESRFRSRMRNKLSPLLDHTFIDRKGNLLGFVQLGDGPTVLLSAHLDTVKEIVEGREIIEDNSILRSSEGILGADDRAGVAAILEILSRVKKTNFRGTLKVAFTVEEEIGCQGSRAIDQDFLEDVDAAIVIDRRGNRDIVTSWSYYVPFCPEEYGRLFEKAGKLAGMDDWKVTPGGISDAMVFAEFGIPSVNLSAGYQNEHKETETVDYKSTFVTVLLVESVLHHQLIKPNTPAYL
ncbi:M20/M25/M40 family metallo-hydrolase [Neobacillus sp. DY30]|uniref:M20/M25/M40 family metallo-hydrolase n=1 Tax=Neobacillus sp. DY30 TaxID=3047871 RepID=UPI0024BF7072|nr:M20/M25/M40 family metallo-hydrolase [Neobacillus sp. DY30]WHY03298.1 M20/M25/M40 family metallo-hydrolase [Neobacillus sp. DY30]